MPIFRQRQSGPQPKLLNIWVRKGNTRREQSLDAFGEQHNPWQPIHMQTQQPSPGAQSWAWETLFLPDISPIGAGTANRHQLMVVQFPPLTAIKGVITTGLGGVVQGQWISAPLHTTVPSVYGDDPLADYEQ